MIARLQQEALLRVHTLRFRGLDGEERGVEAGGIIREKVATSVLYGTRSMAMLFVETINVPSILRNLSHGGSTLHQ
jgi:hypothetical protein